ncbi:MAG: GNAT family N-acetyltransferase [Alphaproteobacteria bacterium]|nr:GNAT family N-acetyltransferase [Alphaproteobacteria bacterium]
MPDKTERVDVVLVENDIEQIAAFRQQAIDWLGQHAAPHGVAWNLEEFTLHATRGDTLIGMLVGCTNLQWLHVDLLAVRPQERRGGVGSALLANADELARKRGCVGIWLDTFDFQAPDFYPRFGFTEFGRIDDMPPGHTRFFFTKRL